MWQLTDLMRELKRDFSLPGITLSAKVSRYFGKVGEAGFCAHFTKPVEFGCSRTGHSTHSPPRVSVLITRGYSMILRCDGVFSSRVIVAFKYADSSLLNN